MQKNNNQPAPSRREFCQDENDIGFIELRRLIVLARCMQRGDDTSAISKTLLPFFRALFEKSKEDYGGDSRTTLSHGLNVAKTLCELWQFDEAYELILDLHSKASRVLGSDHDLTKVMEFFMIGKSE